MDAEQKRMLTTAMMKVIRQERLPLPEQISIRQPMYGVRRTQGKCIRLTTEGRYKLIVSTTKERLVPCPTGNLILKKTGERVKRVLGEDLSPQAIVKVAAHEIAHLKFWNHTPEHVAYTEHVNKLLQEDLHWGATW